MVWSMDPLGRINTNIYDYTFAAKDGLLEQDFHSGPLVRENVVFSGDDSGWSRVRREGKPPTRPLPGYHHKLSAQMVGSLPSHTIAQADWKIVRQ